MSSRRGEMGGYKVLGRAVGEKRSEPFPTSTTLRIAVEGTDLLSLQKLSTRFPHLSRGVRWRNTALTGARAVTGVPDTSRLQSVNMVPFVGDHVIVIQMADGHIMLPGGTREDGESLLETISREMREETGYAVETCFPFLVLECISYDPKPWRPWLAHPEFERLVCLGDVRHVGDPENPAGAEQIAHVHLMALDDAVRFLHDAGRPELAEIYVFAGEMRHRTEALIDLATEKMPFDR